MTDGIRTYRAQKIMAEIKNIGGKGVVVGVDLPFAVS